MGTSKERTLLKKWILCVLPILLNLFFNRGRDYRCTAGVARCLILSLCFDTGNIVCITNMEYLDPGPGLFYNHHHLLIRIRSDERSRVHFADEESFVFLLNLLRPFKCIVNLIKS